ncbi:MAG: hypothetical protein QNJ12_17785 [Ilumatobacter sp.]|uniref:hypothetical protein n=1 Tax=Ilumatobacter sp. TaxID=1967498 RepID=UPI002624FA5C|nr:hypothetical protein [Ilumatobacter sp.]MDJ0770649.1 hypothetical protein [Ilumatobacter sp.]
MIVCRECGTQNDDDDQFCGGCPAFLEWSGEHVPEDTPVEAAVEEPERAGIVTRIKHAISGDELPPPATTDRAAGAPLAAPAPGSAAPAPSGAPPGDDRAAALVAHPLPDEPGPSDDRPPPGTGARPPAAQVPQAAKPRPKVQRQPPSRRINPGDLVCGQCGEGNTPERKFCRRCGNSLVEAEVVKRPWYRRWIPQRKPKQTLRAGARPERGTGRDAARQARIFRGKVLGKIGNVKRLMALLAVVGIGVGFAIPSARNAILDGGGDFAGRVRRIVSPTYSNIPIDPARVSSSSNSPDTEAADVTDGNTLTFWLAAPDDPSASVTVTFVETTDVKHVLVHPGQQESGGKVVRPDPRPRELLFRVTDDTGTIIEVAAQIADEDGFQTVDLDVDAAVSVETVVVNCFPDPVIEVCPITELEFQSQD